MQIRKATPSDLRAILEIENSSYDTERFHRKQFLYLITKAKGLFLVLEQEGKITAYISMITHTRHNNLRIYSLAVHPAYRGQKLAQQLIDKAFEYALQLHLPAISLEVNTENPVAIALYSKNGFIAGPFIEHYYKDGGNALKMIKKL